MSRIQGKTVLITGASSGIGEATALLLARNGAQVVLGARRIDRLQQLTATIRSEGGVAEYRMLNVTNLEEMQAFAEFGLRTFGHVDAIVNNAGVMPLSQLQELKVDEWNRMIDVNIRGVLHGIAAVLPIMQEQGFGQVVNISSIGGHRVHQRAAVYSATTFAVIAISEGLRLENDKIRVTVVSPGVIESELADSISSEDAREAMQDFRRFAISPDAVARSIAFAIEQPDDVDVSEIIVRPTASPY